MNAPGPPEGGSTNEASRRVTFLVNMSKNFTLTINMQLADLYKIKQHKCIWPSSLNNNIRNFNILAICDGLR